MGAVAIGHLALKHSFTWDQTPSIEILFDGKQVIEGKATAFTNGAIEAAIVHSRALLEFLGVVGNGQTDQGSALLEIAFRGVPILVINRFYVRSKSRYQSMKCKADNAPPSASIERIGTAGDA